MSNMGNPNCHVNPRFTFFNVLSLLQHSSSARIRLLHLTEEKKKRNLILLLSRAAVFFLFPLFSHQTWRHVGDPGPHIHYHFKTCCSKQTTRKRICADLVFVSPWLKHLQSCDMNRFNRAEMKLGTYVRDFCVLLLCLAPYLWYCLQVSGGTCVCVCTDMCWNDQSWVDSQLWCAAPGLLTQQTGWQPGCKNDTQNRIKFAVYLHKNTLHKRTFVDITIYIYQAANIYGRQAARYLGSFCSQVHN